MQIVGGLSLFIIYMFCVRVAIQGMQSLQYQRLKIIRKIK